ncbi:cellulase family glycosylhydrolase [Abyssalbus ytuae]|uniref:Cellulase family glycosylhydrolase n=1 Tax=Abyssalbus ytuae TaxID=2926907 RepID=A0A9E6ZMN5_9FLAO|nr:cellulase family glycosylhydrolase [Abyssalbus ytuae]UOB18647.1 cellulase family glycosylhydrolase [Abyssalbus ytuae]
MSYPKKISAVKFYYQPGIINRLHLLLLFIFFIQGLNAQSVKNDVYVDDKGVMKWGKSNTEVQGFGVNYTVPFAHAYRSAKRMGIDPEQAIDDDVYHFSRLGFDLYRVHVWDTEISDTLGNLLDNEHLKTFDYLLKKLKDRGINYVITPIAFWGNGWPEPNEETPGFSHKYGKGDCLTNPDAIKAQENYLSQFLNHVNPYTQVAYKDEPNLIAFEISNEPHHDGSPREVTAYINKMVTSMRKTGCKKPIFYNVSHSIHLAEAYFDAGIQGGTFQWYPTGLGYQRELSGNLLPNVNDYHIPFEKVIKENKGAKLVYEFDAADVGKSYIYPAMVRSFRQAGIQIATHFAYDPTYLAYANTEYNTHYMNLAYTPQKALSLMICSEVFHNIPMYKNYGKYPENTSFENFRVNYENELAELNSEEKFIYTNHTSTAPANLKKLKLIAGFGNSPIVEYNGKGAYFLDKIDKGIWRLEVMPDAIWVDNPFGRNSPRKTVAVIKRKEWSMKINLKELGNDFQVEAVNEGNNYKTNVTDNSFTIQPGTYILKKKGISKKVDHNDKLRNFTISEFAAPATTVNKTYLNHTPPAGVAEGNEITLSAQIVGQEEPASVEVLVFKGYRPETIKMERYDGYNYSAVIPAEMVKKGFLNYYLLVNTKDEKSITYPAGEKGKPGDWDFYNNKPYSIRVVNKENPVYLFNAADDSQLLIKEWMNTLKLVPTDNINEAEYQVNVEDLLRKQVKTKEGKDIYRYTFKHFVTDKIASRKSDLSSKENIVLKARSLNGKPCKLEVAFVMNDGNAYGGIIDIGTGLKEYKLPIKELKSTKTVTLPRPYPGFLPYYLDHKLNSPFDIQKVESVQFSIGPGIPESEIKDTHGVAIVNVSLQ